MGGAKGAHPGDLVLQNPRTSCQVERDADFGPTKLSASKIRVRDQLPLFSF